MFFHQSLRTQKNVLMVYHSPPVPVQQLMLGLQYVVINVRNRDCFIVTKNLTQRKMNPKFLSDFWGSFRIYVDQYLRNISEVGMNQPKRNKWLAKCLPERISHVCRKLNSLTTLWTFIPGVHLLWYSRKQSAIGQYGGQKRVLSKV